MANKLKVWASRRRSLILIIAVLLVIGVLVIVAASAVWRKGGDDKVVDQTTPVPIDTSKPGRTNPEEIRREEGALSVIGASFRSGLWGTWWFEFRMVIVFTNHPAGWVFLVKSVRRG